MPTREHRSDVFHLSSWSIIKVLLVLLGLWLLWIIRDIVGILFVSLLLAALIDPFADWFARHKVPRGLAVLIVYVFLFALLALVVVLILPPLIDQVQQLIANFSSVYGQAAEFFQRFQTVSTEYGLAEDLQSNLRGLQSQIGTSLSSIFSTISNFFGGLIAVAMVLVLAFYMVVEEESARRFVKSLAPVEYQPFLAQLFTKMQKKIGAWLRGQIVLALVIGAASYIGLTILGVPYALVLALIAGLFEIIAYVGPIFATIPAAIIAFSISPLKGVLVIVLYLAIQQLEGNILVPKIMQRVTGLNPIISIVALLIGVKLGGIVGAILAVPVATMASVILEEFFAEYRKDTA